MLEYCVREDLKLKRPRMMAVLDPIKLVIDNYPEGQTEMLEAANNMENPSLVPIRYRSAENYILNGMTSWKNRRRNISVCFRGNEVRLMHAYFVKCTSFEKR